MNLAFCYIFLRILFLSLCTMIEKVDHRVNSVVSGSKPVLVFEENIAGDQIYIYI